MKKKSSSESLWKFFLLSIVFLEISDPTSPDHHSRHVCVWLWSTEKWISNSITHQKPKEIAFLDAWGSEETFPLCFSFSSFGTNFLPSLNLYQFSFHYLSIPILLALRGSIPVRFRFGRTLLLLLFFWISQSRLLNVFQQVPEAPLYSVLGPEMIAVLLKRNGRR